MNGFILSKECRYSDSDSDTEIQNTLFIYSDTFMDTTHIHTYPNEYVCVCVCALFFLFCDHMHMLCARLYQNEEIYCFFFSFSWENCLYSLIVLMYVYILHLATELRRLDMVNMSRYLSAVCVFGFSAVLGYQTCDVEFQMVAISSM